MPGVYYRDALLIAVGGVFVLASVQSLFGWIGAHYPTAHRFASAAFPAELGAKLPAASIAGAAISHALFYSALLAAIGGFVAAYIKPLAFRLLMFFGGAAAMVWDWGSAGDFVQRYLFNCVLLGVVVLGVRWIVRLNLLGVFLVVFGVAMVSSASALLQQTSAFYRGSAYALLALFAAVLAWPLIKWRTAPPSAQA